MATAGEVLFDLVLGNKTRTPSPARRRVVEHVVDCEPGRVSSRQLIQFSLEQDILRVDISVDEADLGLILGVFESSTDDLEHRGDSGSTSDHPELARQARGIYEFTLGALDPELVSNLEEGHVARDVTFLIGLEISELRVGSRSATHTLMSSSKWPRSSSLLVGV